MSTTLFLKLARWIDALNEGVGKTVSWLTALLMLLVCFDVIARYIANDTSAWIMELEWHMFALIFLLGAGYGFRHDRHVRVDLFYASFAPRDKALVNVIGGLFFLIPWCVVVVIVATNYALTSYEIREMSPDPGGLPARYIIKFAIAIGAFLLMLQGLSSVIRSMLVLRGLSEREAGIDVDEERETGLA